MARKALTDLRPALLALALAALAGCAASYPPSPPAPVEDAEGPPGPPAAQAPPVEEREQPPAAPARRAEVPTLALLRQSERAAEGGDVDSAIAYVERAIRLDPRNATLWLRLARLQLEADRAPAAEQLAQRAIALADGEPAVERQAWLLVADAREAQGDRRGAERLRRRWRTYRG